MMHRQRCGCCHGGGTGGDDPGVNSLTVEPSDDPLNEVAPWMGKAGEWICIESVMDPGAVHPVAPPTMAPNVEIRESSGSRWGQH